jgi:hypothetical protein
MPFIGYAQHDILAKSAKGPRRQDGNKDKRG